MARKKHPAAPLVRTGRAARASLAADPAVDAYLRDLDHPRKPEIETLRRIVLGLSPAIREGIHWNAPSFRKGEDFATFHLRERDRVQIVLHTGESRKRPGACPFPDPSGLLEWSDEDRALVTFLDAADVRAKRAAFEAVLHEWIRRL